MTICNYKSDVFRGLNSLLALSLKGCGLTRIDPIYFSHLENLQELSLLDNKINNLEPKLFSGLKKLKRLVLDTEQLTYHNGQTISQDEFKLGMKVLVNKNIEVEFTDDEDDIWLL